MDQIELSINNGRIVTPQGIVMGDVSINNGRIVNIGNSETLPKGEEEEIDAEGNYVIPGFICPHNHMGISRQNHGYKKQFEHDFETETRASLYGGTTSLLTFLLQEEPYSPDLDYFIETAEEQSYIDFGFHVIVHQDHHVEEIESLIDNGIRSFKMFFDRFKRSDNDQLGHSDIGRIQNVFKKISDVPGTVAMFHAENEEIVLEARHQVRDIEGRDGLEAWADSSPGIAQAIQIEQIGMLTEEFGATSYIVHNSSKEAVRTLKRYQDRGVQIYGETLPSFLASHCEMEENNPGQWGKISPPIRYEEDQKSLWQGLRTNSLQHIGTDHAPFHLKEKGDRDESFWKTAPGDQGLQVFLPIMMHEGVNKNRLSMERVVQICSTNNAKLFGLYPRKGVITEGADADLVIVDLDRTITVDEDWLQNGEPRWCSTYGRQLTGAPTHVIKGGDLVIDHDELVAEKGIGNYLPRDGGDMSSD